MQCLFAAGQEVCSKKPRRRESCEGQRPLLRFLESSGIMVTTWTCIPDSQWLICQYIQLELEYIIPHVNWVMIWLYNGHRLQAGMHRVTMGCSAVRFLQIPFVVTPPRLPLLLSLALMPKSYESGQLLYQAGWKWAWCVGIC